MMSTSHLGVRNDEMLEGFAPPHLPDVPAIAVDSMTLAENRQYLSTLTPDIEMQNDLLSVVSRWVTAPAGFEPLSEIQNILNSIRKLPRGQQRLSKMNTFVRTLGRRDVLADLLDMMRAAANRRGAADNHLVQASIKSIKHSVYGWCGQTKIMRSGIDEVPALARPEPGVQALLGKTPTTAWSLSIHIWQANRNAIGFVGGRNSGNETIAEPPHSHPFDFASMVSIGELWQSTYSQEADPSQVRQADCSTPNKYEEEILQHTHGVWPPHLKSQPARVVVRDERTLLQEGDSYYLPCNVVHDVEVEAGTSSSTPCVTLFLRSESVVLPHVYMTRAMATFHDANPDIEHSGSPLSEAAWQEKLSRVSSYLRGLMPGLNLDDVVTSSSDYAFFYRSS